MKKLDKQRVEALIEALKELTPSQFMWLERTIKVLQYPHQYSILQSDLFDEDTLCVFGDALRIHHSFSVEPFSKDKFEFVLEKVVNMSSKTAVLAPKGNPGHDITIDNVPISLKTQANRDIHEDLIWISKFMELGKGKWGDDPEDMKTLLHLFLEHMKKYERILMLRTLQKTPVWIYELVEVPKTLLLKAESGSLEMMNDSRQYPKPGYCYVKEGDKTIFSLYFDGGSERKLQVKNLMKSYCFVHARWEFTIPEA